LLLDDNDVRGGGMRKLLLFVVFLVLPLANAQEWAIAYGGSGYDEAFSIQQTSDGGYVVAGRTYSFGANGGVWVLKLDENGEIPNCPHGSDTYAEVNETQVSPINTSATVEDTNVVPHRIQTSIQLIPTAQKQQSASLNLQNLRKFQPSL